MQQTSGIWCAEFVSSDVKGVAADGPEEPLFDRSRCSQPDSGADEEPAHTVAFRYLGKLNVPEAEHLLNRVARENIRFEINADNRRFAI